MLLCHAAVTQAEPDAPQSDPCVAAAVVCWPLPSGAHRRVPTTATLAGVALFLGHLAHGFHRVAVLFRVFTVALRDEPSNLRRISPLLGTLCLVLGLWPLWCGMHGVSLGTLVSYPLHVGCRTLALPSVPPVVQGGVRTDSGLLHDACWIVEVLSRTNPSTTFMRFSWLNLWTLREISTPSSSSKLPSWITY